MYLLCQVLKDMNKIGIKNIRKSIENHASQIEDFIEKSGRFSYLVKNKDDRSKTIHVVRDLKDNKNIIDFLKKKHIFVSSGYGDLKKTYIRVSCFPAHSDDQIKLLISSLIQYSRNRLYR